jgi:flagellar motor switch/type III secretory pathway protein FliN
MATTHSVPATPDQQELQISDSSQSSGAGALVAVHQEGRSRRPAIELGSPVALLPVELDVVVPVREFRVRNLLALNQGQVIETQWGNGDDVPLASGQVQLAWSEFEVVDSQLGVRVTRLA